MISEYAHLKQKILEMILLLSAGAFIFYHIRLEFF